jgi:hypothetical protein
MTERGDYDWVTDEMFDTELVAQVEMLSAAQLVQIEGVYEVLSEALNNDVLAALEEQREARIAARAAS